METRRIAFSSGFYLPQIRFRNIQTDFENLIVACYSNQILLSGYLISLPN